MTQAFHILHVPKPDRLIATVKTRLRAPEIEIEAVRRLLAYYGAELTGLPRNLTARKRNRNLVVKTSAGKKVLKRYWPGWPASFVVHEHSILTRLAELNFPAPRLVATADGNTFISQADQNYALFEFEAGSNYASNFLLRAHRLKLMAVAGHTLACLHRRLEGFVPEGQHYSGFRSYTGGRWRDLAWHVEKVDELKVKSRRLTEPEDKVHAEWLIQNSNYILEELSRFDETLSQAPLPRLLIHGDYGLHNIHFHKDGRVTPLDFESCRLEWRLRDLVTCLARFRFAKGTFDFESMHAFAGAYQDVYPLSVEEQQLLPQVWRFCKLEDAVKYWNSYFETSGPVRKLISARNAVHQADEAWQRPSEVTVLIKNR